MNLRKGILIALQFLKKFNSFLFDSYINKFEDKTPMKNQVKMKGMR